MHPFSLRVMLRSFELPDDKRLDKALIARFRADPEAGRITV
jgi:hypothetical protein